MTFTLRTVFLLLAAVLAFIAALPIPTGSVNLLAMSVGFLSLGEAVG